MRRAMRTAFSVGSDRASSMRVGVQRLAAAEHGGQRLHGHADDVVLGLLGGERATRGLGVEAQHQRARIAGSEAVAHDAGPEPSRGAELRHLFQEVVVGVEEERELRGEGVDGQAGRERGLDVGDAVGQGEGHLLDRGASRPRACGSRRWRWCSSGAPRARQKAKRSVMSRMDGAGGKMYVPRAMYSFRMSFWMVPVRALRRRTPWLRATAT